MSPLLLFTEILLNRSGRLDSKYCTAYSLPTLNPKKFLTASCLIIPCTHLSCAPVHIMRSPVYSQRPHEARPMIQECLPGRLTQGSWCPCCALMRPSLQNTTYYPASLSCFAWVRADSALMLRDGSQQGLTCPGGSLQGPVCLGLPFQGFPHLLAPPTIKQAASCLNASAPSSTCILHRPLQTTLTQLLHECCCPSVTSSGTFSVTHYLGQVPL